MGRKILFCVFAIATMLFGIVGFSYSYPMVIDGNDDIYSIIKATGDDGVSLLAKYDWKGGKWKFDDGTEDVFDITISGWKKKEPISGSWSTDPSTYVWYVSVKAGSKYALYKIDPASDNGSWTTELLGNKGVSHISFWKTNSAEVPIPSAVWLLTSGIVGLSALRKRMFTS